MTRITLASCYYDVKEDFATVMNVIAYAVVDELDPARRFHPFHRAEHQGGGIVYVRPTAIESVWEFE